MSPRSPKYNIVGAEVRSKAIKAVRMGAKTRDVARILGICQSTLYTWLRNAGPEGVPLTKTSRGRPPKLNDRQLDLCLSLIESGEPYTSQEIVSRLQLNITARCLRNYLNKCLVKFRMPIKKKFMAAKTAARRLAWAKSHLERDFTMVVFSDESTFRFDNCRLSGQRWVPKGCEHDRSFVWNAKKLGGGSLMVWGAISYSSKSELVFIEGNMNGDRYVDVLRQNALPLLEATQRALQAGEILFQQDGAPCHGTRRVREFMERSGVECLQCAACSPDCNIIETVWAIMKRRLQKERVHVTSRSAFIEVLTRAWDSVSQDTIRRLYDTIPKRLRAVMDAKGHATRF